MFLLPHLILEFSHIGRHHLTAKTMIGFRTAYQEYNSDIDWFFKADDDTYVIVENLRYVLSLFDPEEPHYIGWKSFDNLAHGYNSGGAGYALSKAAVKLLVEKGFDRPDACLQVC